MSKPNSRLTRFRRHLAHVIEPGPAAGEAWCVDCAMNDGRTLIVSADGFRDHAGEHRELPGELVRIQVAWPEGTEDGT